MLGIILCDDDKFILGIEQEKIEALIKKNKLPAHIVCTSINYKEVMRFLELNPGTYLYFMDLDFGKGRLNGVDISKLIKTSSPASKIVFVTNHQELALDVLKSGVEPFGFMEKTTEMEKMNQSYLRYIRLALGASIEKDESTERKMIELSINISEKLTLPISTILYVEAVKTISHCICYHTLDHSAITVRDTIEHAMQLLGDEFIRSHRSVLVNQKYIVALENSMVKFANGEMAACSFRKRNEIKGVLYDRNSI